MFNKQSFIVLVNKFIGQIKSLFSRFTKKNPKELMQQSILVIISYKNTIKIFIDKYFERFKLQAKLQKIKVFVEQFKLQAKLQKVKIFAEQIKSWKFKEFVEQIKSFKVKSLLERFAKKKQIEVIPDGILGISINNNTIVMIHMIVNGLKDVVVKSQVIFVLDTINANLKEGEPKKSIEDVITQYIKANNLSKIICSYVLSPQQYVLSLIEFPPIQNNDAKEKAILLGVKDYINYSIDDAILESFEVPVRRTQDNAKLAYAVAMRAKLSEEIGRLLNKCDIHLKYIDINELCIRNIIALYEDLQQGCLVLKISDINNSMLLVKDNALFISRNTKLDIKQLSDFDPNKNDDSDKMSIAENLVLELQRSLDYGNSIFRELHFNSICVLPYDFNLDLFIGWAVEQLGLPIHKLDLTKKIKFEQPINQHEQAECILAIGAALRNIDNVTAN